MSACTPASHAELTRDPLAFKRLVQRGLQEDGDGGDLQLADCPLCGSTLALDADVVKLAVHLDHAAWCMAQGDLDSVHDELMHAGRLSDRLQARAERRAREAA